MADAIPAAAPTPAPAPSKARVFFRRLFSFVILWTVVLTALFSGNKILSDYVFLAVMLVLAGFGLLEFYNLVAACGLSCFKPWGILGGLLLMGGTFFHMQGFFGAASSPASVNDFETGFLILFVLGLCFRQFLATDNSKAISSIAITLLGLMYVAWLLNFIQKINFFPFAGSTPAEAGTFYVLYFIVVTKFSDVGAYCVGSLFGKHKMIPRVSPNKTWEGFIGAVIVSTTASLAFAAFAGARLAGMNWLHAVALGVVLSTAAVVGDLIESIFKRQAGVKDSGRYFPGIGGVLDLLDSLLFNAPLMYVYLRHVLT
ncbi:MAG TPA: phosphatidate cytidylyltransferase [Verrucomicrobiae bacterium]|jgi:phosphatidate cytidylyltransferase